MILLIPSRSRAEKVSKSLACEIPHHWHGRTYVFVPESQYLEYLMHMPGSIQTVAVPNDMRIAEKRVYMAEWAAQLGEETFTFVDDDVCFLVRRDIDAWQLVGQTPDIFDNMMMTVERLLSDGENPYSHVGISAREGNNRAGIGLPPILKDFTRCYRVVAWRTGDYLQLEHGRIVTMEDFDASLQSLRLGRKNCCLYFYAQGQGETGENGGCADWRTVEIHNASAARLAELHPGFVSLREHKIKAKNDMANRTEVTVQWKQAWKSAAEWASV